MTNEDYCNPSQPFRCPVCRSQNVELDSSVDFEGDRIKQPSECHACGAHWMTIYALTGYFMEP